MNEQNSLPVMCHELAGKYKIEANRVDENGNEIPNTHRDVTGWFDNLITNAGLNLIGVGNTYLDMCSVGFGTSPAANSNTALQTFAASSTLQTANTITPGAAPDYACTRTRTFQFAAGALTGNIAEVGVGPAAGPLFSRARIVDSLGSPTTVEIFSDEVVKITYALSVYPQLTDSTGTVNLNGETYSWTSRASFAGNVSYWPIPGYNSLTVTSGYYLYAGAVGIGEVTSSPNGSAYTPSSIVISPYTDGNYYQDITVTWGTTAGINPNINAFMCSTGLVRMQFGISPNLNKTSTSILQMVYRISWARRP